MRVLISGASGFIGASLLDFLQKNGHEVVALTHSKSSHKGYIFWNPDQHQASFELFEGFDAVIHLAGEPLTLSRWGKLKKQKIFQSRKNGSEFLTEILMRLEKPPQVFISASAIGFYGDRGEEELDEASSSGSGFLKDVCLAWENASEPLVQKSIHVMHARFGIVLGRNGGALKRMLPFYQLGLGATLGSGRQWVSWISLEDLIEALGFLLTHPFTGKVNLVAPNPVRQKEFSKSFAKVLNRLHVFKIPAWFLKMILGVSAQSMLLSSTKVFPKKLQSLGFRFKFQTVFEFFSSHF